MIMQHLRCGALALGLVVASIASALGQTNPGTSPLSGAKGGTNNAFMQFTGPATSLKTFTLPNASGTIGVLNAIATWTAAQSYSDGTLILLGSSSGSSTLKAPATGGGTATLFAGSDTIVGRATVDTLMNKTFNCANNICTVRLANDVTGTLPKANGGLGATTLSSAIDTEFGSTRGMVLYRGASGWAALGVGSAGQLLSTGGAGADPSWITVSGTGTVTSVICGLGLSGGTITTTGTCSLASGTIIGSTQGTYATNTTLATTLPADDSIPQSGEGTQIISVSYTPRSASSTLRVRFSGQISCASIDNAVAAMFNGASNAFSAQLTTVAVASAFNPIAFEGSYAPGSTSAQTISLRVGCNASSSAMNGFPSTRRLGGVSIATLTVEEIAP